MKKLLLLILLACSIHLNAQQIDTVEYFIDVDPGVGLATPIVVSPSDSLEINLTISLDTVQPGIHSLYIRAKTDSAHWSFTQSHLFFKTLGTGASQNIVQLEAFFDTDPGYGNGIQLPAPFGSVVDLSTTIDVSFLPKGMHLLYIRGKSDQGYWSFTQSFTYLKLEGTDANKLVGLEYFIDSDPGTGNGEALAIINDTIIDQSFFIDLSGYSQGIHTIYIRSLSENGLWSFIQRYSFMVLPGASTTRQIVALEYFWDLDPGEGNGLSIAITSGDTIAIMPTLSMAGLDAGDHYLYIRAKDNTEQWSFVVKDTITNTEAATTFPQMVLSNSILSATANDCTNAIFDTISIYNTGDETLTFNGTTDAYWLSINPMAGSIEVDDSLDIVVQYNPEGLTNASFSGNLTFTSNDPNNSSESITILFNISSGTAIVELTPNVLDFGVVDANVTTTMDFEMTNIGCTPIDVYNITSSNVVFSANIDTLAIAVGASVTIAVQFTPDATSYNDTLTIHTNDGDRYLYVQGVGETVVPIFPEISLNPSSFSPTVTNCDQDTTMSLTISNPAVDPFSALTWELHTTNLPPWLTIPVTSGNVPPEDSVTITINMLSSTLQNATYQTSILMTSNAQDSIYIPIALIINGLAELATNPSELLFDDIRRNTKDTLLLDIQNLSCGNLTVSSIDLSTPYFTTLTPGMVLPGQLSLPIQITFEPDAVGDFVDTIQLTSSAGMLYVPVSGTALGAPTINTDSIQIHEPLASCFNVDSIPFTIFNTGEVNLLWQITHVPTWASIDQLSGDLANSSQHFISFHPEGLVNGIYHDQIVIESDDPVTPVYVIPVTMELLGAPILSANQANIPFGKKYFTSHTFDTLVVYNTGCDTFELVDLEYPMDILSITPSDFSILPFDSISLALEFHPKSINTFEDTIQINGNVTSIAIPFSGEGIDFPQISTLNSNSLAITMPMDINSASVVDSAFVVWGEFSGKRNGTFSVSNNEILFEPSTPFRAGEKIEISLVALEYADNTKAQAYNIVDYAPVTHPTTGNFQITPTTTEFQTVGTNLTNNLFFADFDKDGRLDIGYKYHGSTWTKVDILLQNTQNEFILSNTYSLLSNDGNKILILGTPDMNNDNYPDLAYNRNHYGRIYTLSNSGNGTLTNLKTYSAVDNLNRGEYGDLDSDGDLDLLAISASLNGSLDLAINDGTNTLTTNHISKNTTNSGAALGDFDKNGYPDIAYSSWTVGKQFQIFNNINHHIALAQYESSPSTRVVKKSRDLNHDSYPDILFQNSTGIDLLLGNSDSLPSIANVTTIGSNNAKFLTGDINGDGHTDIFAYDLYDGSAWNQLPFKTYLNNGAATFTEVNHSFTLGAMPANNLADIDGDGDLDYAFVDDNGLLWIAYNEDNNAALVINPDTIELAFSTCSIDTTLLVDFINIGDSTLTWQSDPLSNLPIWLSLDTTYGEIAGLDTMAYSMNIKTSSLGNGDYHYDVVIQTSNSLDTIHIAFNLTAPAIKTITPNSLDFAQVDPNETAILSVEIANTGCDTVHVSNIASSNAHFTPSMTTVDVLPYSNETIDVTFAPLNSEYYNGQLVLQSDYGNDTLSMTGIGCFDSPVTTLYEVVCSADSTGVDSLLLTNMTGCDSLVVTYYHLPNSVSPTGLIAYYPFNGNANDESGNGHDGSTNGVTLTQDRFENPNSAYNFDGGSDGIIIADHPDLDTDGEFTLSCWINPKMGGSSTNYFLTKWYSAPAHGDYLLGVNYTNANEYSVTFTTANYPSSSEGSLVSSESINWQQNSQWIQVSASFANGVQKLYINGQLVSQTTANFNATDLTEYNNDYIKFGQLWNNYSGYNYEGDIDDIRIYSRALSDTEIYILYNEESGIPENTYTDAISCDTTLIGQDTTVLANQYGCDSTIINITSLQSPISNDGLVGYYPFDGNADDMSGYSNDGTVNSPSLTTDRFGNVDGAYSFDGVNDEIRISNPFGDNFTNSQPISISTWVKTDVNKEAAMLVSFHNCCSSQVDERMFYLILYSDPARRLTFSDGTSGQALYYPDIEVVNQGWIHIIVTYSESFAQIYVNGVMVVSKMLNPSGAIAADDLELVFGACGNLCSTSHYFQGSMDDIRIYKKELTSDEITQLYYESRLDSPTFVVSDTIIDYGNLTIGDSLSKSIWLTNTTCDTLTISNIYTTQPVFVNTSSIAEIPPYQSKEIEVSFIPDSTLFYVGQLIVEGTADTLSVNLQGSACIPAPMLTLNGTIDICPGSSIDLSTDAGIPVTWSTGVTDDSISVVEAGNYYAIYSNNNGCILYTDTLTINIPPDASILVNGNTTLCVGDSTELVAQNATSFAWSTGETSQTIWAKPSSDAQFTLQATNSIGCVYTDSVLIHVILATQPDPISNMIPVDSTQDLTSAVTLSWLPGAYSSTYDLYLWKSTESKPATPTVSNIQEIVHTVSNLELGQTYVWQIHSKNSCFETEGSTQVFSTRFLPDLVIQNVQVPNAAFSGQTIVVTWEVQNQGGGSTGSMLWFDYIALSEDNSFDGYWFDKLMGSAGNVTALGVGEVYSNSLTITLPEGISGSYYLFISADTDSNVDEEDEGNNYNQFGAYIPITLTPPPDLQVTSILSPNNAFSGQKVGITYSVKNKGAGSSVVDAWQDRIYFSEETEFNSNATLLGTVNHSGVLLANASYSVTDSMTLPENISGTYYFFVQTDGNNDVYEFVLENNNVLISNPINVILLPPSDLLVTATTIPDTVHANQPITFEYTVDNQGANPTNNSQWYDGFYISNQSTFDNQATGVGQQLHYGALDVGSNYATTANMVVPNNKSGLHHFFVKTDNNDVELEFSEDNNVSNSEAIYILIPDLMLDSIVHSSTAYANASMIVNWQIKNQGSGHILNRNWVEKLYISTSATFDETTAILVGTKSITMDSLLATQYFATNAIIDIPQDAIGTYYLYIWSDAGESVFEENETNNIVQSDSMLVVEWVSHADLTVNSISVPDTIVAGESFDFSCIISNQGDDDIRYENWSDRVQLINNSMQMNIKNFFLSDSLLIDSTYTNEANLMVPANMEEGVYHLQVVTDVSNDVEEYPNEGNNTLNSPNIYLVGYPKSDLSLSMASIDSDTVLSGSTIDIHWTVENLGLGEAIPGTWNDAVYLSNDTILDDNDQLLNLWARTLGLNTSESYTRTQAVTLPNTMDDDVYFIIKSDNTAITNDLDVNNNTKVIYGSNNGPIHINHPLPIDLTIVSFSASEDDMQAGQPVTVIWTVQNIGQDSTSTTQWNDKLFLAATPAGNGVLLGSVPHQGNLPINGSYSDTLTVDISSSTATGNYYLVMKTDANNTIFESNGESNNTLSALLSVDNPPVDNRGDLIVQSITATQDSIDMGESLQIDWETHNIGQYGIAGVMKEAVYLSLDSVWDPSDILVGLNAGFQQIPALGMKSNTITPPITKANYGWNYIIVRTDIFDNILEVTNTNNTTIGEKVFVDIKELPIDVLTPDVLVDNTNLYYRIPVPDSLSGESLVITLTGDTLYGYNEQYTRYGELPTRNNYHFSHQEALQGRQEVVIPTLVEGEYFNLSYGDKANGDQQNVTLLAKIQPFEIKKVIANEGGNTGSVTIKITGARFEEEMEVALVDTANNTYLGASEVYYINPTTIYASFSLDAGTYIGHNEQIGIDTGYYDVQILKLDGSEATLAKGFHVVEGSSPSIDVNVIAPPRIGSHDQYTVAPITIEYKNSGGIDIPMPRYLLVSLDDEVSLGYTVPDVYQGQNGFSNAYGYREIELELKGSGPNPNILAAGESGIITIYGNFHGLGSYLFKLINLK